MKNRDEELKGGEIVNKYLPYAIGVIVILTGIILRNFITFGSIMRPTRRTPIIMEEVELRDPPLSEEEQEEIKIEWEDLEGEIADIENYISRIETDLYLQRSLLEGDVYRRLINDLRTYQADIRIMKEEFLQGGIDLEKMMEKIENLHKELYFLYEEIN